jgi:hypothetical protein
MVGLSAFRDRDQKAAEDAQRALRGEALGCANRPPTNGILCTNAAGVNTRTPAKSTNSTVGGRRALARVGESQRV